MEEFGLGGGATQDDKEVEPTKALFRDKKLTRLWEKVLACLFFAFTLQMGSKQTDNLIDISISG